jgi:hypothetical protein
VIGGVGVCVGHGWNADTSTALVLLQLRTDAGAVGVVSLCAELAQTLVDQVEAAIAVVREGLTRNVPHASSPTTAPPDVARPAQGLVVADVVAASLGARDDVVDVDGIPPSGGRHQGETRTFPHNQSSSLCKSS